MTATELLLWRASRSRSGSRTASATSPPRHQTRTLGNRIKSRTLKANTNRSAVQGQFELAHIAVATRIAHVDAPMALCGCITIAAVLAATRTWLRTHKCHLQNRPL